MGRTPSDKPRKYQIEALWDLHREIIRRLVLGQGNKEIARALDITPVTVSYVKNSELGKKKRAELQHSMDEDVKDVTSRIQDIAPKALDVLENIIAGNDQEFGGQMISVKDRYRASKDVLEKAGHVAPNKVQGAVAHAVIDGDYLDKLKQRAKEADNVVVDMDG